MVLRQRHHLARSPRTYRKLGILMARRTTAAVRLLAGDKEPVRLASTGNLALAGLLTVDGVVSEIGDRILVKDQTNATENGIYTASERDWQRAPDSNSSNNMIGAMKVAVQEGDTHAGDVWNLDTDRPDLGDDDIVFSLFLNSSMAAVINAAREALVAEADAIIATAMAAGKATQAEAEAAVSNVGWMTPLRTRQQLAAVFPTVAVPTSIFEVGPVDPQDATPAWNAMIAAWKASGHSNWYIPTGLVFNSKPDDINSRPSRDQQELYSFNLRGNSPYRTTLYKNFESLNGTDEGVVNIRQNDVHISDIGFISLAGSRNAANTAGTGCLISAVAPQHSIGYASLRNIEISSGGSPGNAYHGFGMYFNGGLGSASEGLGIRGYVLSGIKCFGGEVGAAQFDNCASLSWMGGSTHIAGGNSGALYFTGINKPTPAAWSNVIAYLASDPVTDGGLYYRALTNNINKTPASNPTDWELQSLTTDGTFYVNVQLANISGGVICQNAQSVRVTAGELSTGTISFTSEAIDCHVKGRLTGGAVVSNNGTNCTHNGIQLVETSATDGYIRHEDGTIEQWMVVAVGLGDAVYNFPIAFPTKCLTVDVTPQAGSNSNVWVGLGGFTVTQVVLRGSATVAAIVRARGY